MNDKNVSVLMIILGLIALLFPIVSTQTIGVFTGLVVGLVAIGLLFTGILTFAATRIFGLLSIVFAFICFLFSYNLMFNPEVVSSLISFIIYIIGFIMIVMGILAVMNASMFVQLKSVGITTLIFGIITLFVGVFMNDPAILGSIIGIWLIVSGLLSFFGKKENVGNNDYIDV